MTGRTEKRVIGQFEAQSRTGKIYTIIEYQNFQAVISAGNTVNEVEGPKTWVTSTGKEVKQLDDETYQITSTREVIKKLEENKRKTKRGGFPPL